MLPEEIEADYWAHYYAANPATESSDDAEFNTDSLIDAIDNGDWEDLINERCED